MCRKYHVKHISQQYNLDRLKSGSKRDTNETPTCAVPMHAPQTNALWWGEEGGTTKALLYTLPRRVGDVEGRAVLSEDWGEAQRYVLDRQFYGQNGHGYEVQRCGWGSGGSEVWLHSRVLWGCEARYEILAGHGEGSDEHKDKQSRRCRAPIIGFAAALWGRESLSMVFNMVQIAVSTQTNRFGAAAR